MSMDGRQMFDMVHNYRNVIKVMYVDTQDNQQECTCIAESV